MDFAKKQLQKYGWKDGEGLGKDKNGISNALKPKLKFDKGGLGHDVFDDLHNAWWQRLYDEAAKNIVTAKDSNDCVVLKTIDDSLEITTKRKTKSKSKRKPRERETVYGKFVKTSELRNNVEKSINDEKERNGEEIECQEKRQKLNSGICELTDEELFKVCGGRTAHKGARHGLKMSAKLARIEQQESSFLTCETDGKTVESGEGIKRKNHKKQKRKHKESC